MPSLIPREVVNGFLEKESLQSILEQDRIWSAYALADLDPEHEAFSHWYMQEDAVLLRYEGLHPPVLFALGPGEEVLHLCEQLPAQTYQISLPARVLEALESKHEVLERIPMLRMHLKAQVKAETPDFVVRRLTAQDIPAVEQLYLSHPESPDGFHPRQLESGIFFGAWEAGILLATAGTHVLSKAQGVAAVGNIFTHPAQRKRGLARACTQSVLHGLEQMNISTIVLNVAQVNEAALQLYQQLGFQTYCPFFEGRLRLA